jgi:periplasmic protein TonB
MRPAPQADLYSPGEIARAAGVSEDAVRTALGHARDLVSFDEAVRVGRVLSQSPAREPQELPFDVHIPQSRSVPLLVSSTLHVAAIAVLLVATFNLAPRAASLRVDETPADLMHLVFLATPGPGGGGGGGGLLQKTPAPKALREGKRKISSPLPERVEPTPIVPAPKPVEPKPEPPLKSEQLPAVMAPIITAPADTRNRVGVLTQTTADADSHGPGVGGGAGTGKGTGLGEGDGSGVGPGAGGGTGGGPYRPGSGIEPPRLLHEVKADYTEDARQRSLSGEVVLEIVVRRDGSVGDVRILQGLGGGLNDRAVQAVRQWRFAPARRLGTPVDVIVEVAVEFRLR